MSMKYFKDGAGVVHGFDTSIASDVALMNKLASTWTDVTASWPPPPPALTLVQQAQAALSAGITITSTGTPALDGTYSVDDTAMGNIRDVQTYINTNSKLPGSTGSMVWLDKTGTAHIFPSVAEFAAFATAAFDYVYDLRMIILTGTGTLPTAAKTIS